MTTADIELHLSEDDDCVACAERLREGLSVHRGVAAVEPVVGSRVIRVSYDPDVCSPACLDTAASDLRLDLERAYAHRVCRIEGMDCADCARKIERAVSRVDGVTHASVNFPAQTMRLEYEPAKVEPARIDSLIDRLGYRVEQAGQATTQSWFSRVFTTQRTTIAAVALLAVGLAVDLLTGVTPIPFYLATVLVGGLPLARSGVVGLWATRRPDINLLMTIAAVGAAAIDAWLEAALVVTLFSIGGLLEARAVDRARRELAGLVSLTPKTARLRSGENGEVEVPVEQLVVGDVVIVRPGEMIPVDGTVREGASAVDQAPITGESTPVDKAAGDNVFAGTLNHQGMLLVEATSAAGETTLERIGKLVAEAQARKSPSERWVDSFARWYTPAVVVAAVAVAIVPTALGVAFTTSFYAALALLIIACPCALVISTPVSIVSALGRCSSAGVLVKGGAHLEQAAAIRAVAFDKTGTLTEGRPEVVSVEPLEGSAEDVLAVAASLEQASEHPLAKAIVRAADARGLAPSAVENFQALTGLGARGRVGDALIRIGDPRLLEDALEPDAQNLVDRARRSGYTAVVVARNRQPIGVIALADTIRPGATDAITELRRLGIGDIVLLTGDNATTAAAIAGRAGIDNVRASLLPEDKAQAISDLGDGLAMVGDGVNDAPALAAASLGIAMGSAGSDTAIEVADVAIMGDDPRKVAGLIGLARWTKAVVRQNIAFSLATKLVAVGVLAAGELPLWGAVTADVGASLIVVANGLRLIGGRPGGHLRGAPLLEPVRSVSRPAATPTETPAPSHCGCDDHDHDHNGSIGRTVSHDRH